MIGRHRPFASASGLRGLALALAVLTLGAAMGCAVPQQRGKGDLSRRVEPSTKRGYWLYLPSDYVKASEVERARQHWPLVMTFHGMKPFDNAHPQALEWQYEADRYGFVVVAPELRAPDVLGEFPIKRVSSTLRSDEQASLAILDHVFATTNADPRNILSTSWSSGGYIAHYMFNRHPDRFTTLAVRQSNFSASVLDPDLARRGNQNPALIINTQNDFAICREESRQAVQWYTNNGYRNLAWVIIKDKGHERTPDLAADFFGRVAGVEPRMPNNILARRQAIDGNAIGIALLSGRGGIERAPTVAQASSPRSSPDRARVSDQPNSGGSPARPARSGQTFATGSSPAPGPVASASPITQRSPEPPRYLPPTVYSPNQLDAPSFSASSGAPAARPQQSAPAASPPAQQQRPPVAAAVGRVGIRVSSAIGIEPLSLGYSAECPASWLESADFLWTVNGEPVGHGMSGSRTLSQPGEYTLALLVVTQDGAEHRARRTIRVLPRLNRPAGS